MSQKRASLSRRKIRGAGTSQNTRFRVLGFSRLFTSFWPLLGSLGGCLERLRGGLGRSLDVWDGPWDALGGPWTSLGAPRGGPRKSLGVILARLGMLQARLGVTKCTPGRKGSDLGFIRVHFFLLPCMLRGLGVGCARTKL